MTSADPSQWRSPARARWRLAPAASRASRVGSLPSPQWPLSQNRSTRKSRRMARSPPEWSGSECESATRSSRVATRFHRSGASTWRPTSRRRGPAGPPSTSRRWPSGSSTSVASPWPTSRNVMRSSPSPGRSAGQAASARAVARSVPAAARTRTLSPAAGRSPSAAYQHAAAPSPGAGTARAAPGTAAAARTTARSPRSAGHAAWKSTSAASAETAAAARAPRPMTVAAPASGTTARLAAIPTSESWLKWLAMTGVTATCAVRLTARAAASHGGRPRSRSARAAPGASQTIPAVAAKESWKPGSHRSSRSPGEEEQPGEGEGVQELGLALEEDRSQDGQPHDRRADHRRFGPDNHGEADDGEGGARGARAPRDPDRAEQQEHARRDQGHVESRHREHVEDAGPPEGVLGLRLELRALAQEQAAEQRGRGGGQVRAKLPDRPAPHPDRPRGIVGGHGHDAVGARAANDEDPSPGEIAPGSRSRRGS